VLGPAEQLAFGANLVEIVHERQNYDKRTQTVTNLDPASGVVGVDHGVFPKYFRQNERIIK